MSRWLAADVVSRLEGLSDLSMERELYEAGVRTVVGMDEVGRGCIAGPVGVGAALFRLEELLENPVPAGIRDSKRLSEPKRRSAAAEVRSWAGACAVGYASPAEVDECGIGLALGLAGRRALTQVPAADLVLLDGSFDWLSVDVALDAVSVFGELLGADIPPVRTFVRGDDRYLPIAAASVLAKVDRDSLMADLARQFPEFGWERNAGYPTPAHKKAIAESGPSVWHRRSFKLI